MRFPGRSILVTGGGSGIGAATAQKFAENGAQVVVADINAVAAAEVAERIGASVFRVDVTDPQSVSAMIGFVLNRHGKLDCAINNAGVGGAHKTIFELNFEDWRRTIDVNLSSVFHCIKAEAEAMRGRGGAIVNTARGGILCRQTRRRWIDESSGARPDR